MVLMTMAMNAQSPIAGTWNTGQKNTKIEIVESGDVYVGKIASSDNSDAKIGKTLIKDIAYTDGEWKGQIYLLKREEWAEATFTPKGDILEITVGSGFMSKTIEWTKAE